MKTFTLEEPFLARECPECSAIVLPEGREALTCPNGHSFERLQAFAAVEPTWIIREPDGGPLTVQGPRPSEISGKREVAVARRPTSAARIEREAWEELART